MSTGSSASSDPPADLEKGAAAGSKTAEKEEPLAVVDERKANLIRAFLDLFFVIYLLFYIGVLVVLVMVSDRWWDSCPGVLIISPICIATLWLTPKMKDVYIQLYATKLPPTSGGDLTTKLLVSEK
ncbi:hypothetical protein ACP70R_008079 [Stipagrostis hirtigluma subsp. patula]